MIPGVGLGYASGAQAVPDVVATRDVTGVQTSATPGLPTVGLMADVGVPDGIMAAFVVRPTPQLRMHIGAGSNTSSPGVRGGLSVLPFGAGPSLTLEGGQYLNGQANGFVRSLLGGVGKFGSYVGRVSYMFANAHAGLELGRRDFTFFVHGGVSYVKATLKEVAVPPESISTMGARAGMTSITFNDDPVLKLITPSVKVGLVFFLQ